MKLCSILRTFCFIFVAILITCLTTTDGRRTRHTSCQSPVGVQGERGVKIEPLNTSHVLVHSLYEEFGDGHQLSFQFKTFSSNGLLFYATRRNDPDDMVSVEIANGKIQFKIRCRSSYADLTMSTFNVDDGEWHQVTLLRKRRKGAIRVDNKQYFRPLYLTCGGFTSLSFGNISPEHEKSKSVQELKKTEGQFTGCIRHLVTTTGVSAPPRYVTVSSCN